MDEPQSTRAMNEQDRQSPRSSRKNDPGCANNTKPSLTVGLLPRQRVPDRQDAEDILPGYLLQAGGSVIEQRVGLSFCDLLFYDSPKSKKKRQGLVNSVNLSLWEFTKDAPYPTLVDRT